MALLHVATLTVKRELPKYEIIFSSYLGTKNETMALLHVATLTVKRLNMRLYLASRVSTYLGTKNETMAPLHVATLTVQRELPKYGLYLASRVSWYQE